MLSEVKEQNMVSQEKLAKGILFVVSSPSGGGKGTLIQRALKLVANVSCSVSYTTRKPRPGEVNAREYFFVSTEEFQQMIDRNDFLEWAVVYGNLYGTARTQVTREIDAGRDIILEVDVQGAASVRNLIPESVSIFILPPSFDVLRERLITRATDSNEELEVRLRTAPKELKDHLAFDYLVTNDHVDRAAADLAAIICAERLRIERQKENVQRIIEAFVHADEN